ncbi:hypothetical protein F2Q69_00022328 [Brassica cretica]|uniref:Uncharacterized protein n=1 Tax=Brassica cretica TaxID=69181 RepID=A0A8S9QBD9_BRACR|nr:hypothetical protein F2Q69_00022328 [Brassica cretica]
MLDEEDDEMFYVDDLLDSLIPLSQASSLPFDQVVSSCAILRTRTWAVTVSLFATPRPSNNGIKKFLKSGEERLIRGTTIDFEPWIYASKKTSIICDRSKKSTWILRSRVDWAEEDHRCRSETDSGTIREEAGERMVLSEPLLPGSESRRNRCCQSHRFPETKASDSGVEGITASQNQT